MLQVSTTGLSGGKISLTPHPSDIIVGISPNIVSNGKIPPGCASETKIEISAIL